VVLDIPWNPMAGLHNLSFYIVIVSGPREYETENDARTMRAYVGSPPAQPADTWSLGGAALVFLIASVAFVAGAFVISRRARRRRLKFSETRK
jgi:hypothetical protein